MAAYRLAWRVLAVVLGLIASSAIVHAQEMCTKTKYQATGWAGTKQGKTPLEACQAASPAWTGEPPPEGGTVNLLSPAYVEGNMCKQQLQGYYRSNINTPPVITDMSPMFTQNVGPITTVQVQEPCDQVCEGDKIASQGYYSLGFVSTGLVKHIGCSAGCQVRFDGQGSAVARRLTNNKWEYLAKGSYTQDGTTCQAGDGNAPSSNIGATPSPNTCASGQVLGTFNNKPMCLNTSTGDPVVPENQGSPPKTEQSTETETVTKTTNPDGSETTTRVVTRTDPDGSTTTRTETTTRNPDGSETKETAEQTEKPAEQTDDFCTKNPKAEGCGASSFGGGCGGFSCEGDAVTCAIAKEQHQRNCSMFETETALSTLGKQVSSGQDPLVATLPSPANAEIISIPTAFNQTSVLGAQCIPDMSIPWRDRQVVLPFSELCGPMAAAGLIAVAFALIMGLRIVGEAL